MILRLHPALDKKLSCGFCFVATKLWRLRREELSQAGCASGRV